MQTLTLTTPADAEPIGPSLGCIYRGHPAVRISVIRFNEEYMRRIDGPLGIEHFPGGIGLMDAARRYWAESVR